MTTMISRRRLLAVTGGAGAFAEMPLDPAGPVSAQSVTSPRLWNDQASFEEVFGTGANIEGALVQYPTGVEDEATYAVRFTDDNADLIEVDLSGFADGTLPEGSADMGQSRFLPEDVTLIASFSGGDDGAARSYDLSIHSSESLAADTGRTGNVMVLDIERTADDGPGAVLGYISATVAMETADVLEVVPTGASAMIGDSVDDWHAAFGEGGAAQRFSLVDDPPVSGLSFDTQVIPATEQDDTPRGELPVAQIVIRRLEDEGGACRRGVRRGRSAPAGGLRPGAHLRRSADALVSATSSGSGVVRCIARPSDRDAVRDRRRRGIGCGYEGRDAARQPAGCLTPTT